MKENVIDRATHRTLGNSGAQAKLVRGMVELYLKGSPGLLETIHLAAENDDEACLVAAIHALRVSSENVGATRLASMAQTIEHRAEPTAKLELQAQLRSLQEEHRRAHSALARIVSKRRRARG